MKTCRLVRGAMHSCVPFRVLLRRTHRGLGPFRVVVAPICDRRDGDARLEFLQRNSFISTTSLVLVPRESANCLPSLDIAKLYICSVLKLVTGLGGLSSRGILQTFVTP